MRQLICYDSTIMSAMKHLLVNLGIISFKRYENSYFQYLMYNNNFYKNISKYLEIDMSEMYGYKIQEVY